MRFKKILIMLCLLFSLLLSSTHYFPCIEAREYLLKTESSLTIIADTNDFGIVAPGGSAVYTNITIIYEYGRLARPKGFPFPNKRMPTTINLTVDMPRWCSVELNKGCFEASVETFLFAKSRTVNLSAKLTARTDSQKAPAFEEGIILLNATAEENGNVLPSSATYEISIKPDFVPFIEVSQSNTSINLVTGEETNVSVIVKNKANAKIVAALTTNTTDSENLEVFLPTEKLIDVDEEISFPVRIKAKESEEQIDVVETIKFTVSYHAENDESLIGEPLNAFLKTNIKSDGTDLVSVDFATIILSIAIVLVAAPLMIIYIFYRKRRR